MRTRSVVPRRPHRSESGAVAVEFALLVPLLLLVVLATVQYGSYFYARQGGSDVARDAARRAAVGDQKTCAAFRSEVESRVAELAGAGEVTVVKRTYTKSPPSRPGDLLPGDQVTVEISFTSMDLNVPFVPVPDNANVIAKVTSRLEYVPTQPETCS